MTLRQRRLLPELHVEVADMGAWWSSPNQQSMRDFRALCARSADITNMADAKVDFSRWAAAVGEDAATLGAAVAHAHADAACDFWLFSDLAAHVHVSRVAVRLPKRRRTDTRMLEHDTYAQKLAKAKCRILDCWGDNPIVEIHELVASDGFFR